jgi:hypothetical protein
VVALLRMKCYFRVNSNIWYNRPQNTFILKHYDGDLNIGSITHLYITYIVKLNAWYFYRKLMDWLVWIKLYRSSDFMIKLAWGLAVLMYRKQLCNNKLVDTCNSFPLICLLDASPRWANIYYLNTIKCTLTSLTFLIALKSWL